MLHIVPVLVALLSGPVPATGTLVPVSLQIAEDVADDERPTLEERVSVLRRAVCEISHHVRLVSNPAEAAVPFEIEAYEVTPPDGDIVEHHVKGRYYRDGKWQPFQSYASGESPSPPGLGSFVETSLFDVAAIEWERLGRLDAHGRLLPRKPADVSRCIGER